MSSKDDRPVIVIELVGEEEGAGQAGLSADQRRIQRLLGLVGLGLRRRSEERKRVRVADNYVKPRHWCAERLHAEKRAGWCTGGDTSPPTGIGAVDEGVQAVDRGQQATGRDQAHFDQIASRYFSMGISLDDFSQVSPRVLSFLQSCFGRIFIEKESVSSINHRWLLQ